MVLFMETIELTWQAVTWTGSGEHPTLVLNHKCITSVSSSFRSTDSTQSASLSISMATVGSNVYTNWGITASFMAIHPTILFLLSLPASFPTYAPREMQGYASNSAHSTSLTIRKILLELCFSSCFPHPSSTPLSLPLMAVLATEMASKCLRNLRWMAIGRLAEMFYSHLPTIRIWLLGELTSRNRR